MKKWRKKDLFQWCILIILVGYFMQMIPSTMGDLPTMNDGATYTPSSTQISNIGFSNSDTTINTNKGNFDIVISSPSLQDSVIRNIRPRLESKNFESYKVDYTLPTSIANHIPVSFTITTPFDMKPIQCYEYMEDYGNNSEMITECDWRLKHNDEFYIDFNDESKRFNMSYNQISRNTHQFTLENFTGNYIDPAIYSAGTCNISDEVMTHLEVNSSIDDEYWNCTDENTCYVNCHVRINGTLELYNANMIMQPTSDGQYTFETLVNGNLSINEGSNITTDNPARESNIYAIGNSYLNIRDSYISEMGWSNSGVGTVGVDFRATDVVIENTTFTNNQINLYPYRQADRTRIINNTFNSITGFAIRIASRTNGADYNADTLIDGNTIYGETNCIQIDYGVERLNITNNVFWGGTIYGGDVDGVTAFIDGYIYNNIINYSTGKGRDGIYIESAQGTIIDENTIHHLTYDDNKGNHNYAIRINNQSTNTNITNNVIYDIGADDASLIGYGIYTDDVTSILIEGNTFDDMGFTASKGRALWLEGIDDSKVYDTTITPDVDWAVYLIGDDNELRNIYIESAGDYGFYSSGINNSFEAMTIKSGSDYGMYVLNDNCTFKNLRIYSNAYSNINNLGVGNLYQDTCVYSSGVGYEDFALDKDLDNGAGVGNGTITCLNCSVGSATCDETIDQNNVFIPDPAGSGYFTIDWQWYLDVYVNDTVGNPVELINITAENVTGSFIFGELTDGTGYITQQNITEHIQNFTDDIYATNYTFSAINSSGYFGADDQEVNITTNQKIVFTIERIKDALGNTGNALMFSLISAGLIIAYLGYILSSEHVALKILYYSESFFLFLAGVGVAIKMSAGSLANVDLGGLLLALQWCMIVYIGYVMIRMIYATIMYMKSGSRT